MSRSTRAVVTAVAASLLAAAAFLGATGVSGAVALLVVVLAIGWPRLLDLPSGAGSTTVLALVGLGGVAAVVLDGGTLGTLPFVVACGLVLAFLVEMLRRDGRPRLVESLTGTVAGLVVAACGAGWTAVVEHDGGPDLVVVSAGALAAASVAAVLVPWKGWSSVGVAVAAGAAVGTGIAALVPVTALGEGVVVGAFAGVLAASLHVLLEKLPASTSRWGGVASAVVPVLVLGVVAYVVGDLLGAL
ncbi:hypothetical protein IGS67_03510 [Flavimobilis sp. GY10621]|uniref:Uncharacterized protein n=1 Tax=Flavimobilis rhizosphaerae TaxID=2775421 RepID=A0ABR9DQF3_9MICO|nr:hypothetical protein [Flavimobilis rhizosphaerae]MBD9698562.1 hypothetical protein [Flavimobilis rhizosphaerae]